MQRLGHEHRVVRPASSVLLLETGAGASDGYVVGCEDRAYRHDTAADDDRHAIGLFPRRLKPVAAVASHRPDEHIAVGDDDPDPRPSRRAVRSHRLNEDLAPAGDLVEDFGLEAQ